MSATTVLPDPTSPCSRRCMGAGRAMSAAISRDRGRLVVGERERQRGVERGHERAVDRVHDARWPRPPARACAPPARAACAGTRRTSGAARRPSARPSVSGRWMPRYALPRSTSRCSARQVAVERIGEAPRLRALQARRHRAPELPGVHLGLPRLRVHGHDGAGDVGAGRRDRRARRRRGSSSGACPR